MLLAVAGVATLIRYAMKSAEIEKDATALALLVIGITASAPAFSTLVNWPRYELLPVVFLTVLVAIGTASLLSFAAARVRNGATVRE